VPPSSIIDYLCGYFEFRFRVDIMNPAWLSSVQHHMNVTRDQFGKFFVQNLPDSVKLMEKP